MKGLKRYTFQKSRARRYIQVLDFFFFFNDTATTEIYTLSLHDALPISRQEKQYSYGNSNPLNGLFTVLYEQRAYDNGDNGPDRKSTRLNSSHANISYAVFCLKKKNNLSATHTSSQLIASTTSAYYPP